MNNTPPKPIRTLLPIPPGSFITVYPVATFTLFILSILTILLLAAFY